MKRRRPKMTTGIDQRRGRISIGSLILITVVSTVLFLPGVDAQALRCQCSRSTESAHCSNEICEIKPRDGKVPACVYIRDGRKEHYACIRVKEETELGCRVIRNEGRSKSVCTCRDEDMCNVDMSERVEEDDDEWRIPAEIVREPLIISVTARNDIHRQHNVLLKPDRDDTLGVAPSEVNIFDDEGEDIVYNGGGRRRVDSISEEENTKAYRPLPGVDLKELVPLKVKKLVEDKRSKLDENIIDLTKQKYPSRQPDWRQPGSQPLPDRSRSSNGYGHHQLQPLPPPPSRYNHHPYYHPATTTTTRLPPLPTRQPTPFSIGVVNSFVEQYPSQPIPYPNRWNELVPATHRIRDHTTTTTVITTPTTTYRTPPPPSTTPYRIPTTTTTLRPRPHSVSWSKSTVLATIPMTAVETTVSSTTTTSTSSTTTSPTTTTTTPSTTTTVTTTTPTTTTTTVPSTTVPSTTTTTTVRTTTSTVAPTTMISTTVDYDDMDEGEEIDDDEEEVVSIQPSSNHVYSKGESQADPDSGSIVHSLITVVLSFIVLIVWY